MRHFLAALVLCLMAFPALAAPRSHHHAIRHHRHHHHHHRVIDRVPMVAEGWHAPLIGGLVAEAERHLGATGSIVGMSRAWCGAFARLVVRSTTGRDPGTRFNVAAAWARLGSASAPVPGAVAVAWHHVGFIKRVEGGRILLVSGNHGRKVGEGWYDARRFFAFRAV